MTIYEFALQMEKDGENFYRENAAEVEQPGFNRILNMLADDEVQHYRIIEAISKEEKIPFHSTRVLDTAKNIFKEIQGKGEKISRLEKQKEIYLKAQEIEKKSESFYSAKSFESASEEERKLFLRLAGEEKKHLILIENLIEFISRPDTWIENAEFNQKEEY